MALLHFLVFWAVRYYLSHSSDILNECDSDRYIILLARMKPQYITTRTLYAPAAPCLHYMKCYKLTIMRVGDN